MDGFNFKPQDILGNSINQMVEESKQNRKRMIDSVDKKFRDEKEYNESLLRVLKEIKENTSGLPELIGLIRTNGDKSDEIYDVLTEILALAKAKDMREVESKFDLITNKTKNLSDSVETSQKLYGYALIAYNFVKAALITPPQ